jgi:hypothetical protein
MVVKSAQGEEGAQRLHAYWTKDPRGLAKWASKPDPWTSLYHELLKFLSPERAKQTASRWFIDVFHFAAGSDLNRVTHGHPPRGKRIGPG